MPRPESTYRPLERPRSVYIHIPFCRHRCGYCNFSLVADRDHLIERFLNALRREIGLLEDRFWIDTLFLGGGTPSHLSIEHLQQLSQIVRSRFEFDSTCEITAECNPGDLNRDKAEALAGFGVNRISLGVQSLDSGKLKRLERDHSPELVAEAMENARSFARSVSMDLIFGAPDETIEAWKMDLDQALELKPDHVSTYELTFEKGTQFWNRLNRGELKQSDDHDCGDMYEHAIDRLATGGLRQYEVSSFAAVGHRCRHNEVYWSGDPYFAFGPGASRFVDGVRETNHRGVMQYLKRIESGEFATAESERLAPREAALERLVVGLRRIGGVMRKDFKRRTGMTIVELTGKKVDELIAKELMASDDSRVWLTRRGIMVSDWIASELLD